MMVMLIEGTFELVCDRIEFIAKGANRQRKVKVLARLKGGNVYVGLAVFLGFRCEVMGTERECMYRLCSMAMMR
jgi:hypothetical protein